MTWRASITGPGLDIVGVTVGEKARAEPRGGGGVIGRHLLRRRRGRRRRRQPRAYTRSPFSST